MEITKILKKVTASACAVVLAAAAIPTFNIGGFKASAYTTAAKYCGPQGSSFSYYNSSIATATPSASWLSVSCTGRGNFTVRATESKNVSTTKSSRWGYVDFKNSKGSILYRISVNQTNPYLNVSIANSTFYAGYKAGSATPNFTLTYNSPFSLSSSGSNFDIYNGSGGKVTSGGSYLGYNTYYSVSLHGVTKSVNSSTKSQYYKYNVINRATGRTMQSFTLSQSCFQSRYLNCGSNGYIFFDALPNAGKRIVYSCDLSLPVLSGGLDKKHCKIVWNSSTTGTLYLGYPATDVDPEFMLTEIGTVTYNPNNESITLTCNRLIGGTKTYTFK